MVCREELHVVPRTSHLLGKWKRIIQVGSDSCFDQSRSSGGDEERQTLQDSHLHPLNSVGGHVKKKKKRARRATLSSSVTLLF